jgi:carboxylesterase type B
VGLALVGMNPWIDFCSACPESASRLAQGRPGGAAASGASDVARQREDCLNLNIYTKPQVGEKKKAVLVWIYGGGMYKTWFLAT